MKILITNDDGISAPQLPSLIRFCQKLGQVTVVAPKGEQSAKSHAIEIREPIGAYPVELVDGAACWAMDSTPADCVRFALFYLKENYDLVISGINRGYNLGQDIPYSGTFAAAEEAAVRGVPALAISSATRYYDQAAGHLEEIFRFIQEKDLFAKCNLYNINIPSNPKGFRFARQGGASWQVDYVPTGNGLYYAGGNPMKAESEDETLDTVAARRGYITVTPMVTERTDRAVWDCLANS